MKAIINARLILENKVLENGVLLIEEGKISAFGSKGEIKIPENAEIYDAAGLFVGPGFVDIHCHGGGGYMFDSYPEEAAEHFLKFGTTTVLPTFYSDLNTNGYIESTKRVRSLLKEGKAKNIGGIYMEGPYTNAKFGACPEKNKWRGEIKESDYNAFTEALGDLVRVWVIAPEREGLEPFVKKALKENPSVAFSVGHSEATPGEVGAYKKYNLSLLTHCMDATGRAPCPAGTRNCGPDEACFLDDDMFAEVICDSKGIHVNPDMLKLILKVKGKDKVILISDSFVSSEPTPSEFAHITDLMFDRNGGLCGSQLTLNVAVRNMMMHTGASVNDCFLMATRNPARAIGLETEIGTIEVGKKANLVIVDDEINVHKTILEGEFIC